MKRTSLGILLSYLLLVVIWGSTWIAIKISVGNAPFTMAAVRFLLASLFLMIFQKLRRKSILIPRGHARVIVTLGIGNFFIGYGFTYWGMQYVNSNVTSILWATMPVMVVLFAQFMLKNEKINRRKVFSLVGSLVGSYLIFDIHARDFDVQTAMGMLVILVSIAAAAYSNVFFKREGSHLDPVAINTMAMLTGAILLMISGLILEPWNEISLSLSNIGATLYLALFGSAIGFSIYFWLFKHIKVVKMSYTTFLIPILASFWGWVILGEVLTPLAFSGAVLILFSVSLPELRNYKLFK